MASVYTIPLLFLNLGGEMLYILDQRLRAQRIPKDRAHKGMEVVCNSDRFVLICYGRYVKSVFFKNMEHVYLESDFKLILEIT